MKNLITIIFISLSFINLSAQNEVRVFAPSSQFSPDLSIETKNEIDRQTTLLAKDSLTKKEEIELDTLINKYGEAIESIWSIVDGGCSWYCGGGNYKISASSELQAQKNNKYIAESANDLSYKTAWVEGKKNSGIGEFIEFSFQNRSPRITSIIISNGYMKSDKAWKNNNRVKLLKLYVNDKVFGILKLTDTKTDQTFKIGTFGHNENGSDLVLKFEIVDIYKGEKYDDTAITEIYFDGIDVH